MVSPSPVPGGGPPWSFGAPPSVLSPFAYTNLIWTVSIGYLVFGDLPDRWTWLGAAVIVASGLYTLYREGVRRRDLNPGPT